MMATLFVVFISFKCSGISMVDAFDPHKRKIYGLGRFYVLLMFRQEGNRTGNSRIPEDPQIE